MILVWHFIVSTNEIFVAGYGLGYQSTYLATNNSKVPFFLPTVYAFEFFTESSLKGENLAENKM